MSPPPDPAVMSPRTKLEQAADHLRRAIIEGRLQPGDRVVIDQIARDLAMSPIPVREAIKQLEAEQLVTVKPHAGAVVTPLSRHDIVEVFDLLTALEGVAAGHAHHRDEGDLARLDELLAEMDALADGRDQRAWVEANIAFHLAIADCCRMPLLTSCTRSCLARWQRIRLTLFELDIDENCAALTREHHAIVEAIRARDDKRLERLLRAHNDAARAHYLDIEPDG